MNTAAASRQAKEKHPEHFCREPRCLYRTVTREGFKPCPKHAIWSGVWSPDCRECGAPFNDGDMPPSGLCRACEA